MLAIKLKMKNVLNHYKCTQWELLSIQNPQLLTFPCQKKNSFQAQGQIGLWHIFQLLIHFGSQLQSKATNYLFFFTYFDFLPLLENFEHHCLLAIKHFQCLSIHNPQKFQEMNSD